MEAKSLGVCSVLKEYVGFRTIWGNTTVYLKFTFCTFGFLVCQLRESASHMQFVEQLLWVEGASEAQGEGTWQQYRCYSGFVLKIYSYIILYLAFSGVGKAFVNRDCAVLRAAARPFPQRGPHRRPCSQSAERLNFASLLRADIIVLDCCSQTLRLTWEHRP